MIKLHGYFQMKEIFPDQGMPIMKDCQCAVNARFNKGVAL